MGKQKNFCEGSEHLTKLEELQGRDLGEEGKEIMEAGAGISASPWEAPADSWVSIKDTELLVALESWGSGSAERGP